MLPSSDGMLFNCTSIDIMKAINSYANTAAEPDGISFSMIKRIAPVILQPLLIIFQQSLAQGSFPTTWKSANITALYKGKGEKTAAASYKQVSLCSCFGKVLEKIVKEQLQQQIEKVYPLSSCQHGFRAGRSTVSNLLSCDSVIADLINDRKPYDIISFDFQRAFDKVPHNSLLKA